MSILDYRLARAVLAGVFILFPAWYILLPTFDHFGQVGETFLPPIIASGKIDWKDGTGGSRESGSGSFPLITKFFGINYFDTTFTSASIVFSPSSNGYDALARWQVFHFLMDLGPVYVVWMLEGLRRGNGGLLGIVLATTGLFVAQLVTLGLAGPLFYSLHYVFGTSARGLKNNKHQRTIKRDYVPALLPLTLGLHYAVVFLAYFSPDHSERHWWIWAWQPAPLFIAVLDVVLSNTALRLPGLSGIKNSRLFSASTLLVTVGIISLVSWTAVLWKAPYSVRQLFVPAAPWAATKNLVLLSRELLQLDFLASFGSTFAWLMGLFLDMYAADIITGAELATAVFSIPVASLVGGPGVALLTGWWWRETKLAKVD
ncbi:hypothetical protein QBC43DRAFT_314215, partial [Cladorrhinum sp. PSN259]